MKIIISTIALVLAFGLLVGVSIGILPLAIFVPEHGAELVRIQASGAALAAACLVALIAVGIVAGHHFDR